MPGYLTTHVLDTARGCPAEGIAIALYPILKRVGETAAVGYLSIRAIEGATGVVAAVAFLWLLAGLDSDEAALQFHDAAFLMVLIVFSVSTLILYPTLFYFRIVPAWISLWGLAGGILLLASCLMIAFGVHTMGSTSDGLLSLPIAINEMVLAVWLIFRGVSLEEKA